MGTLTRQCLPAFLNRSLAKGTLQGLEPLKAEAEKLPVLAPASYHEQ